ncbi:energy-coupling factor transport system permease protein [Caloranaerobacter azorensis DSM 13643]|uniref:Energy-coupling factor transporter transmembrane protein EcfT n=1 Tax=Caloranaerobacter azorensis DSM 13643 TaxID=1121264 RepID=A0A1M5U012_9FIRM|nr:energy-coupling factor transporter transmembrane component T [Caloranaerobacter azorensis]SHH56190.1 energy-coupling factor transport system permease protein [Caloranaerobacter azorensis DSM 13643]
MIKDITIGQYYPGNTVIHKLDPRIKIIITFLFIIALFFIDKFLPYLFVLGFIIMVISMSKIPVKYILKGLKPLLPIIIITFLLNLFMTRGQVVFEIGPLDVTIEGLNKASFMAFRLIFLIVGTSLLTLTTSPISLTDGIEKLLNPFKKIGVPAHELAMMMTIALRFIPTLLEEAEKIMKAQMARGADFESGNVLNRAKSLVPLLVPLFISAFRRADELAMAMEARCYRGGENRTRMKQLILNTRDFIAMSIMLILFVIILLYRYL